MKISHPFLLTAQKPQAAANAQQNTVRLMAHLAAQPMPNIRLFDDDDGWPDIFRIMRPLGQQ